MTARYRETARSVTRGFGVAGLLVVVTFTLVTAQLVSPGGAAVVATARGWVGELLGPVRLGTADVRGSIGGWWQTARALGREADQTERLRASNALLARENARLRAARLMAASGRTGTSGPATGAAAPSAWGDTVAARVIAFGGSGVYDRTATIDAGRSAGIAVGTAVLTPDGLVGRVLRVADTTATVLLLGDPRCVVGARVAGARQLGLLRGNGYDTLELTMIDPAARPKVGARVVTWGSRDGLPYPAGIPVGRIVAVSGPVDGSVGGSGDGSGEGSVGGSGDGSGEGSVGGSVGGPVVATVRPAALPTTLDTVAVVRLDPNAAKPSDHERAGNSRAERASGSGPGSEVAR